MSLLRRRKRKSSHVIFWSNGDNKLLVGNTARASILARVISEVTGFVLEETATTPHRSVYTLRQRPNVYIVQQRKLSKKTRSKKSRKRKPLGKK